MRIRRVDDKSWESAPKEVKDAIHFYYLNGTRIKEEFRKKYPKYFY